MRKHTKTRHELGWIYRGHLLSTALDGGYIICRVDSNNKPIRGSVRYPYSEAERLSDAVEMVDMMLEQHEESTPQEYHGYTLTRSRNRNFRTPDRLWRVSIGGVIVHRCSSLDLARTYVDAAVKIDTYKQAREAIAAVEAKLGKGHELTCQCAIHTLGWDQDGEQAAELVRIYQGRA